MMGLEAVTLTYMVDRGRPGTTLTSRLVKLRIHPDSRWMARSKPRGVSFQVGELWHDMA